MPAPAPSARTTPVGVPLKHGHGVKVTFATAAGVEVWEQDVTPPGIESGDPIDLTNSFCAGWRIKAPRKLKELTDGTFSAFYKTSIYTSLAAICGIETTITIHFPDGSSYAFFGYLKTIGQAAHNEGNTAPKLSLTVVATNVDPGTMTEQGPVYTAPAAAPMFANRKVRPRTRQRAAA